MNSIKLQGFVWNHCELLLSYEKVMDKVFIIFNFRRGKTRHANISKIFRPLETESKSYDASNTQRKLLNFF